MSEMSDDTQIIGDIEAIIDSTTIFQRSAEAKTILALLALLRARRAVPAQASAPEGWKLVPIEPTEAMKEAAASFGGAGNGYCAQRGEQAVESYRYMLHAAPVPAQGEPEATDKPAQ